MRITLVSITLLPNRPIPLCRELLLFAPLLPQWPDGRQFREGAKRHASFVSKIHVVWSRNSSFWRSLSRDPTAWACVSHRNPGEILFAAIIISLCNDITHDGRQWYGGHRFVTMTGRFWMSRWRKTWKLVELATLIESGSFLSFGHQVSRLEKKKQRERDRERERGRRRGAGNCI